MTKSPSLALALFLALAVPAAPAVSQPMDFSQAQVVEIALSNFAFTPSDIHLRAGRPTILRLTSTVGGGHNFSAPEFFAAASVRPSDAAAIRNGKVEIAGHQSVEIALVPAAGRYTLKCTHLLHAAMGMRGTITVE